MDKPKTRRVVIQRKVSAGEYEKHKARMESIGLDPNDPVPPMSAMEMEDDPGGGSDDPELPRSMMAPPAMGNTSVASRTGMLNMSREQAESALRARDGRKMVSLQKRTYGEQIGSDRHDRAIERFNKQQDEWEKFRHHASSRLGRGKHELVVTKSEEHRERKELMELLERATPEEVTSGGYSWYHSLRGEGTRFMQVGNMFSGLHLPIKTHKENYVHEIVRKPLMQEVALSRIVNEDEPNAAKPRKTWRDDEYLLARMRRYRKKMDELAPGRLEMHEEFCVAGTKIDPPTFEPSMNLDAIFEDSGLAECDEDGVASPQGMRDRGLTLAPVAAGMEPAELLQGPHFEIVPDKLQFEVGVKTLGTQSIRLKNVGSAAVAYEWIVNDAHHGFQESVLPDDPTRYFMCTSTRGRILPGAETIVSFTFTSKTPGVFTQSWCLKTSPELLVPINEILMHGVAVEKDLLAEQRGNFHDDMFKEQVLHQVQELIEDVVDSVKLDDPAPLDISSPIIQERVFEETNTSIGLYYTPHSWNTFVDLGERVDSLKKSSVKEAPKKNQQAREDDRPVRGRRPVKKVPPPVPGLTFPVELGIPSAQRLEQDLTKMRYSFENGSDALKEKQDLQVELAQAVRMAKQRPYERSELWWLAYETVMEVAAAVPDKWCATRKANELKPVPIAGMLEAEERQALLGEPEKEEEVLGKFVQGFGQDVIAPAVSKFATMAHEASMVTKFERVAGTSLRERMIPYMEQQNLDSVEMGGSVVMWEVDLAFLVPFLIPSSQPGEPPQLNLDGDEGVIVKQRLQGILPILESSPLSVLVVTHLGSPAPDGSSAGGPGGEGNGEVEAGAPRFEQSPVEAMLAQIGTRMLSLACLEPLLDMLKDICESNASSVEFVPHDVWLGTSGPFAEKVRSDDGDRKVFLLDNMSAFPEDVGLLRTVGGLEDEEVKVEDAGGTVRILHIPWKTREAWAVQTFKDLQPEFFVQDSFTTACQSLTSQTGLWVGAPTRIVGSFIETEINAFVEVLQLPFRNAEADGGDAPKSEAADAGANEDAESERMQAPLLAVLGGGGFSGLAGEEVLVKKLELVLGVARIAPYEKDGLILALGGELALCFLSSILGVPVGNTTYASSTAVLTTMKGTLFEVLKLGVTLMMPTDVKCEEAPGDGADPASTDDRPEQVFLLTSALAAAGKRPVALGFVNGAEYYLRVDAESGVVSMAAGPPLAAELNVGASGDAVAADGEVPADGDGGAAAELAEEVGVPKGWLVRDIGDGTTELFVKALKRCRGVLWNGVLGVWEDEKWQRGTRNFLAAVEARFDAGGDDEEEEEAEEDDEDDEKPAKEEQDPEVDWEIAVVIGRDSKRLLPSLMEDPSRVNFVSQSGDGLLQLLRGGSLPGLLACAKKT